MTALYISHLCHKAMRRILNTRTNTAHKPRDDRSVRTTKCGSLVTATHDSTRVVSDEEIRTTWAIDRCGRCFEDASGY
ncbi:hypothetical protein [Natronorubrum sp. FCH18a]|uniref:hypothetical protein n=1 Tax=Natronorubrum sp. FCH18a TaxID=3447018 RepID=UPI003F511AF1